MCFTEDVHFDVLATKIASWHDQKFLDQSSSAINVLVNSQSFFFQLGLFSNEKLLNMGVNFVHIFCC